MIPFTVSETQAAGHSLNAVCSELGKVLCVSGHGRKGVFDLSYLATAVEHSFVRKSPGPRGSDVGRRCQIYCYG
jgi:hypothetical protein